MELTRTTIVFDTADLEAESAFWAGALGGTVRRSDDWHSVEVDGRPVVAAQLAPDHQPPDWPDGSPQQVHLDLFPADVDAAHEEVLALGGRLVQDVQEGGDFKVYVDPAGHPFCLCW